MAGTTPGKLRGRRSLSGAGESPQLRVRLPDDLHDALSRRATQQGMTVSELARRILAENERLAAIEDARARPRGNAAREPRPRTPLSGPLGRRLLTHRREVLDAAAAHGITNVRVFGSVARGDDGPDSDIDLLVDIPEGMGVIGLGRARGELERILDARVDLVPATDLKPDVSARAGADLVPL